MTDFISDTHHAITNTPAGHLVRFSGHVRAGDLEWTINARWQPVHASLVGKPINDPLRVMLFRREKVK